MTCTPPVYLARQGNVEETASIVEHVIEIVSIESTAARLTIVERGWTATVYARRVQLDGVRL